MDSQIHDQLDKLDDDFPAKLEFENRADATGFWFAAAVLFAVLAAGVIVYRGADPQLPIQTAANYATHPAAESDPLSPANIWPR